MSLYTQLNIITMFQLSSRSCYCSLMVFFFLTGIFATHSMYAQGNKASIGSGYCLDFTPNKANSNHVDLGALTAIDTGNFSIEMWVNVKGCVKDPPFFSNKDWSSGNNPGIVFDIHDNGSKLRVNLKTNTSTFQNLIIPINTIDRGWFHLAVTLDRNSYLKIYIDGIEKNSLYFNSPLSGSFASPYTYKLGQDGTGNYTDENALPLQYDGKLDEIRIWKKERTEEEIQRDMCKRIPPHATDLYAYYSCDTVEGTVVKDLTGAHTGKWIKGVADSWTVSGAAIGDTSIQLYPQDTDWNGVSLRLSDTLLGAVTVKNILATTGLHIYKVNSVPNFTGGLPVYPGNANYYGVYLAGATNSASYDLTFDYTNYATAVADKSNLKLFTRNQNSDHLWSEYMAEPVVTNNIVYKQHLTTKREYILGTKAGLSCLAPYSLFMNNQTDSSCMVSWVTGGASEWNTQWGIQGFELGTGNNASSADNPRKINGMKKGKRYDFYVQDKCSSTSTSYWVGPFSIYPQTCLSATNYMATQITDKSALLTWKGNGTKSDVEWGLLGFTLGQGIPDSTFNDTLLLKGLAPNTSYAYFVKTNCPAGSNPYNGPFTFKTQPKPGGIEENELSRSLSVYPNPSNGELTIQVTTVAKKVMVQLYNATGEEVFNAMESTKNGAINQFYQLNTFTKGLYFLTISDGINRATKPVVIQ